MSDEAENELTNIVLFDGVCNLCNTSVDFIIRHETENQLRFVSLQSDLGSRLIKKFNRKEDLDSILFLYGGRLLDKSEAAVTIATFMNSPYSALRFFRFIPRLWRDWVYMMVAKNRYTLFGKKESCRIPTTAEKAKFLG